MKKYVFLLAGLLLSALYTYAQHQYLRHRIDSIVRSAEAKVGVAICLLETNDTLTYQNAYRYVMQSVFKFPIAMAVLHEVDKGNLSLLQPVYLLPSDLPKNYSPLRDKYKGAHVNVTIKELLDYMVTLSDNDACDILLKLLGGPRKVERYVHRLGIKQMEIRVDKAGMGRRWPAQYQNWCEPMAQVELLKLLYHQTALSANSNQLLYSLMLQTKVGGKRLRAGLPPGTPLAHCTGTSATNAAGLSPGTNDVGIITLPNGQHLAIAVLETDSHADMDTRESVMAEIARAAYQEFVR